MGLQTHPEDSEHYLLRATVEAAPVKVGHADHSPSKSRQQAPPAMQSHMSCLKLFWEPPRQYNAASIELTDKKTLILSVIALLISGALGAIAALRQAALRFKDQCSRKLICAGYAKLDSALVVAVRVLPCLHKLCPPNKTQQMQQILYADKPMANRPMMSTPGAATAIHLHCGCNADIGRSKVT